MGHQGTNTAPQHVDNRPHGPDRSKAGDKSHHTVLSCLQALDRADTTAAQAAEALAEASRQLQCVDSRDRANHFATMFTDTCTMDHTLVACRRFGWHAGFLQHLAAYVQLSDDSNGVSCSRPAEQHQYATWIVHQVELASALTTAVLQHDIRSPAAAAALTAADSLVVRRHQQLIQHVRAAAALQFSPPDWHHVPRLVASAAGFSSHLKELTIRAIVQRDAVALKCCSSMGEHLLLSSRCCGFWMSTRLLHAAEQALCRTTARPLSTTEGCTGAARSVLQQLIGTMQQIPLRLVAQRYRVSQGEAAAVRTGLINNRKLLPKDVLYPVGDALCDVAAEQQAAEFHDRVV